jgi:membrane-associated phospholipid phosphatase
MSWRGPRRSSDPIVLSDRQARPLYIIIGCIWVVLLLIGPRLHLTIDPELAVLGIPVVLSLATAWLLKRMGWLGAATALECVTLLATAALSFVLLSFLLVRLDLPYIDRGLSAFERSVGFDWPAMAIAFSRVGWLCQAANFVYQSLWWQMTVLVLLHCMMNERERCWTFALAWASSLTATLAIFAIVPAIGAYAFYHLGPDLVGGPGGAISGRSAATLDHLRLAASVVVRSQDLDGVVEFPSFHTASAVLLAWGFWSIKPARYLAVALNAGVILAAVPIGGHYLIDIPAGAAVAAFGIKAATIWRRFEFRGVQYRTTGGDAAVVPAGI